MATREMNLSFKDWRGNEIKVGSTVIYPAEYEWHKSLVEARVERLVARVGYGGVISYTVGVRPLRESAERETSRYGNVVVIHHWWNLMALPEGAPVPAPQPIPPTSAVQAAQFLAPPQSILRGAW